MRKISYINSYVDCVSNKKIAFEILNFRYTNDELITVISSEKTIKDLLKIDEATAGRIVEKTRSKRFCNNILKDPSKNFRFKT